MLGGTLCAPIFAEFIKTAMAGQGPVSWDVPPGGHFVKIDRSPGVRLPDVFYDPRSLETDAVKRASLHAKCIVVDRRRAFVSSANFTEAAQQRNLEVGVLVPSERFAATLADHFETLASAGLVKPLQFTGASAR